MQLSQIIYDIIRKHGPISRIDIHRDFHIRKASVTRITDGLLEKDLISVEGKEASSMGRAPELLWINDSAFHVVGLHAVSGGIRGGIVSSGGKVVSYSETPFSGRPDKKSFLDTLLSCASMILKEAASKKIKISGISLAMPGEVDFETGSLVQAAVILPGLTDVPCRVFLEKKFKLPVVVDHDCAMITQAELFWGAARSCMNAAVLFIGHGIGGKFVINEKLYRGARNRAGELGHIPLRHSGPLCNCGLKGCFEALASIPVIEKNYGCGIRFGKIVERAFAGEKKALDVLNEAAGYIGEAVAVISDMLDLDMIVINGDIIAAAPLIENTVSGTALRHQHSKQPAKHKYLAFSSCGLDVGVIGSAAAMHRKLFEENGIEI